MNKCIICNKYVEIESLKNLRGIQIFKCSVCGLGFIDNAGLKLQNNLSNEIHYSIKEYNLDEIKQKERFLKLFYLIRKYKSKGSLLDVGAGFGLFSSIFEENKYNVSVIEPHNKLYYLKNPKNKIYKKKFDAFLKENRGKYDVILMIDILEHLLNPKQSIRLLKNKMKERAIVVIQVPNYSSLMAKICINWSWWMIEDHKYFFTPASLNKLMEDEGYVNTYFNTYEDAEVFKKNLDGNFTQIKNDILRKLTKAFYYIPFFTFYFLFKSFIWKLGYGGLIFGIYTKNE